MNEHTDDRDYRFVTGLAIGSVVGASLALWLAPRAATEIKERAVVAATDLGKAVTGRYRRAKHQVTDAADGIARKGQELRDGVYDKVARAAHGVEMSAHGVQQYVTEAKSHKASS